MPVDRTRRDTAAEVVTSFLRREIGYNLMQAALGGLTPPREAGKQDASLDEILDHVIYGPCFYANPETQWAGFCRRLAFLKTDLEIRQVSGDFIVNDNEDRPREILLARWHALGLLVAFGAAYLISWWVFAAATLLSYLLYQYQTPASWRLNLSDEQNNQAEWYPFADEEEWLEHKHILDEYHLPPYQVGVYDFPGPAKEWPRVIATPVMWACMLAFAPFFLISAVIWPLFVVLMSLGRRET